MLYLNMLHWSVQGLLECMLEHDSGVFCNIILNNQGDLNKKWTFSIFFFQRNPQCMVV